MSPRPVSRLAALAATALLLAGCQTYTQQSEGVAAAQAKGDYAAAAAETDKAAAKAAGTRDDLIWRLNQGAANRAAGKVQESVAAFATARDLSEKIDKQPEISVSREVGGALVNQTAVTYTGTAYDRVMLHTYQALNYLELGETDKAGSELIAAAFKQSDAIAAAEKRAAALAPKSADASEQAQLDAQAKQVDDVLAQDRVKQQLADYAYLDDLKTYALHQNPLSTYLHGLYMLHTGQSQSEWDQGRNSLAAALQLAQGENPVVSAALADAEARANAGTEPAPAIYVFVESGRGPYRTERRFDLPLIFVSKQVPWVSAAIPKLQFTNDPIGTWKIGAEGGEITAVPLADIDAIVAREFKDALPGIVRRTVISTLAKAAIMYGINDAVQGKNEQNVWLQRATQFATATYVAATARADLRQWTHLPKQVQLARIYPPADRRLTIAADVVPGAPQEITVMPGQVVIVWVKHQPGFPLSIRQARLK